MLLVVVGGCGPERTQGGIIYHATPTFDATPNALILDPMQGDAEPTTVATDLPPPLGLTWAPDGRHVVYLGGRVEPVNEIIWDAFVRLDVYGGDEERTPMPKDMLVFDGFDLSPDGELVAFSLGELVDTELHLAGLAILELDSGEVTRFPDPVVGRFPSFSRDGTEILHETHLDDGTNAVDVMDLFGSHLRRLATSTAGNVHPRWSPDGMHVAYHDLTADGAATVLVVPAGGGDARPVPPTGEVRTFVFAWSPDGARLAYLAPDLVTLDVETWTAEVHPTPAGTGRLTWSPTSDQLLVDIWVGDEAPHEMELAVVDLDTGGADVISRGWSVSFADWD